MLHHTKTKGDLGVLKVKLDLYQKEYMILNPETEHSPFDIVIYKDGIFKSIEVKYRTLSKIGVINVSFKSSWADKNGTHSKKYDKSKIDYFAIYCPETDDCYYINPNDYKESVSLRINKPQNNQSKNILWANDYRSLF